MSSSTHKDKFVSLTPWPHWLGPAVVFLMGVGLLGAWTPLVLEVYSYQKTHTFNALLREFSENQLDAGIIFTLKVAFSSAMISGVLGTLCALAIAVSCQKIGWLGLLITSPLFIPHVVAAQMLLICFGQTGLLNRIFFKIIAFLGDEKSLDSFPQYLFDPYGLSAIGGLVFKEVPFVSAVVLPAVFGIFHGYGPVARNLGITWFGFMRKILFPTVWPAALVASLMCFAYGLVAYEIPVILGQTFPKVVAALAIEWYQSPVEKGQSLAICLGGMIFGIGILSSLFFFHSYHRYQEFLVVYRDSLVGLSPLFERDRLLWKMLRVLLGFGFGLFLLPLWPLLVWSLTVSWPWPVLWPQSLTPQAWKLAFEIEPSFLTAGFGSLFIASATTFFSIVLFLPVSHWLVERKNRVASVLGEMIPLAPLFIPSFMTAMGMSRLLISLQNTSLILVGTVITHIIAFSPYLTFNLSSWLMIQGNLEEQAAATLGVRPLRVYIYVTLPKLMPAIWRGSLFVFIASFGDVLLTMMTQGYTLPTLPMTLMPLLGGSERSLAAVGGVMVVFLPMCFWGAMYLIRGFLSSIFRTCKRLI